MLHSSCHQGAHFLTDMVPQDGLMLLATDLQSEKLDLHQNSRNISPLRSKQEMQGVSTYIQHIVGII